MTKFEVVILDWAGTTLDFGCFAPAVVFKYVFENEGVPITMAEARKPMGIAKDLHIKAITEDQDVRKRWKKKHGKYPNQSDVDRMFEQFVPEQLKVLPEYCDLIPGASDSVHYIRENNMLIGSTTGYNGAMVDVLLKEAEDRGYIPDVSVASDGNFSVRHNEFASKGYEEGIKTRPWPDMCLLNARELNNLLPSNQRYEKRIPSEKCIKVDDTIKGIEEGVNAGMKTVGLALTGSDFGRNLVDTLIYSSEDTYAFQLELEIISNNMYDAGANIVVPGIWKLPEAIEYLQSA